MIVLNNLDGRRIAVDEKEVFSVIEVTKKHVEVLLTQWATTEDKRSFDEYSGPLVMLQTKDGGKIVARHSLDDVVRFVEDPATQ